MTQPKDPDNLRSGQGNNPLCIGEKCAYFGKEHWNCHIDDTHPPQDNLYISDELDKILDKFFFDDTDKVDYLTAKSQATQAIQALLHQQANKANKNGRLQAYKVIARRREQGKVLDKKYFKNLIRQYESKAGVGSQPTQN